MSPPIKVDHRQDDLFVARLSSQLNPKHPLMILNRQIAWEILEESFALLYQAEKGHPPKPIRLMCGLLMLQHMEGLSDEAVVEKWIENPYWQSFCGYDYLQWRAPIDPSSLTRWRHRLGVEGMEKILSLTIAVSVSSGVVKPKDLEAVIVDTTVMEKAVRFPTDAKLLSRAREQLISLSKRQGLRLRQTYTRVGQKAQVMAARYGHAGQFRRMDKQVKRLKIYLGRVVRDIERKLIQIPSLKHVFEELLDKSKHLLNQTKESKHKLYSLHAPEVECIAKGKAHKRYEFGCKVSLAVTHKQGLVLSSQALHGNPYDGNSLAGTLAHAIKITGHAIQRAFVDKGYKGHGVKDITVFTSGQKKLSRSLKRALHRRSAIEPHIGHMKNEGKLGRNYLKGALGDKLNALLVAIGHNLRLILNFIKLLLFLIISFFLTTLFISNRKSIPI